MSFSFSSVNASSSLLNKMTTLLKPLKARMVISTVAVWLGSLPRLSYASICQSIKWLKYGAIMFKQWLYLNGEWSSIVVFKSTPWQHPPSFTFDTELCSATFSQSIPDLIAKELSNSHWSSAVTNEQEYLSKIILWVFINSYELSDLSSRISRSTYFY